MKKKHFWKVLSLPQEFEPLETVDARTLRIYAEVPRQSEIKQAIKRLKANKVPGPENIIPKFLN